MKKVVWGIIGCGDVTEVKSGPAFNKVENSELLAVMRRDAEKAKDYAERHNVPLWYDNADDLLQHKDITAIYIATPPSSHLGYALKAIQHNKDIYIEKPMTLNYEEALVLIEALEKSSSKLTVAHYRRKLPMFLEVKRIIDEKLIGDINAVEVKMKQSRQAALVAKTDSNWRIDPSISGGGYFNDLAPHQIDLLLYWFGNSIDFSGESSTEHSKPNVASKVNGTIDFKDGITCIGHWNFVAEDTEQIDVCYISGTKGHLRFPFFGNEITSVVEGKTKVMTFEHPKHIQQPIIEATVIYFLGQGENPCPIEDGAEGLQIIDRFIA
ncbi:Gfo/Idh/MocA family oxidoreductase [uncultured Winogradskyella sp.]|uniref:Gfo/Idh/MocA family protein n=1 Tax=uncultured Winogradskyella sp. TaxID=395353 RepID=UPI0026102323|nr:Gfo/Idh/MocA family oxidoreductase [uncultured Winogradskyella sp.]